MVQKRSIAGREPQSRPSTPATNGPASEGVAPESQGAAGPSEDNCRHSAQPAPLGEKQAASEDLPPHDETQAQPTADDIFQNIRTQYFEALYHSMVGQNSRSAAPVLTYLGITGVFCKGSPFQGACRLPLGLRLKSRNESSDRFPEKPCADHDRD